MLSSKSHGGIIVTTRRLSLVADILTNVRMKVIPGSLAQPMLRIHDMRSLIVGFFIWMNVSGLLAQDPEPDQPYTAERSQTVRHSMDLRVVITAPYKTKLLRVWIPIPPSDTAQTVLSSEMTTFPTEVLPRIESEPVFGNRFAYLEFANPQGAIILQHRLEIEVSELRWQIAPAKIQSVSQWPESFGPYLRHEAQAVVVDGRFERLLEQIVPLRSNPLRDLTKVMEYADHTLKYDHGNASLKASSVHALEQKSGHCSDYHGFCAAMGRLMGQPTRVTYGINTFPKASPSHCKLETFLHPYGWVSFDVSETQKMVSAIRADSQLTESAKTELVRAAHLRLVSGFRDNTWFKQTQGTDYDLAPKASRKVAVVRTIYAEADGVPLPDPDPSAAGENKFAWMTAQKFSTAPPVRYPYADYDSLQ